MTESPTNVSFYSVKTNQVLTENITDLKEISQRYKIKIVSNNDN